ncbi:VanZ family protein [Halorubrum tibetense]|uniref:VanZ family protein n=1 Tax=Halorubrum tibetense TaxID=175631 RepID=A0ABD5SB19_9EURY
MTDRSPSSTGRIDRLEAWRPAVAFATVVFVSSVVPIPGSGGASSANGGFVPFEPLGPIGLTDPFHLVGYAVLAALVTRATGRTVRGLVVAVAVATVFGLGIEVVQAAIPWRGFAWRDVFINAVGATAGGATVRAMGFAFRDTGGDGSDPR